MSIPYCYGIDFGTARSCIAGFSDQRIDVIENELGYMKTPSVVSFEDGKCLVGAKAYERLINGERNTFHSIKRLIGRKFDDPILQEDMIHFNFSVIQSEKNYPLLASDDDIHDKKTFSPEFIHALVLNELIRIAKVKIPETNMPLKAVLTVPANFDSIQRRETIAAGHIAGIDVIDILSEPTAAAICYAYMAEDRIERENVLVFDFGANLNVSVVEIDKLQFSIKSTASDTHCGGSNVDELIIEDIVNSVKDKTGIDLREPEHCEYFRKLKPVAINIKEALTFNPVQQRIILVPGIEDGFQYTLEADRLKDLCVDLIPCFTKVIEKALENACMRKEDINNVIMTNDSSMIPFVHKAVSDFMEKEPISSPEGISRGAAIYGANILRDQKPEIQHKWNEKITVNDITPMNIGYGVVNGVHTIVPEGTPYPHTSLLTRFIGKKGCNFFKIKVFEGESKLVSEVKIYAEDFEVGKPVVNLALQVNRDGVSIIAKSKDRLRDIQTEFMMESNSPEEIEAMKNNFKHFLSLTEKDD